MLKFKVLACDNDGTLVQDNQELTDKTRNALDLYRSMGGLLLLVTGETVKQLSKFKDLFRFDLVIAENGALLYWPKDRRSKILSGERPDGLVRAVRAEGIELQEVGEVIISATASASERFASFVEQTTKDWHVIWNRDEAMALPIGIDKVSGLKAALDGFDLCFDSVAAIGDGQNDVCMINACGFGVGPASADRAVLDAADLILLNGAGKAVVDFVEEIIAGGVANSPYEH